MKIYGLFLYVTIIALLTLTASPVVTLSVASDLCANEADCECKGPNCPVKGGYNAPPPEYMKTNVDRSWEAYTEAYKLMNNGHLYEAADWFQRAIKYNRQNHEAYNSLGVVYQKLKRYDDAATMYSKAVALGNSHAGDNLASLLDILNKEKAEAANSEAVKYERLGEYEKAIELYNEALRIRPGYRLAQENLNKLKDWLKRRKSRKYEDLGAEYENRGFPDLARDVYKKALEIDPGNTTARQMLHNLEVRILRNKAHEYAEQGNADKAREYYREILKLDPDNQYARDMIDHMDEWIATYKGGKLEKKGDYEKAAEYYSKALKHNPEYKEARTGFNRMTERFNDRAVEYHKSGDSVKAREFLQKVLEIDPSNQYARGNLRKLDINESNKAGARSMDEGDYDKAAGHFRNVLELDPGNEYARESLHEVTAKQGTANVNRGNFSAAAEYYRNALSVDPDDEDMRENLRMAEKVIGWKKALTGRSGKVPLPTLPTGEEIEEKFIDVNVLEWPGMKAALSFAGELKETAKAEAGHFLKVQAVEQLYKSTIGKYKFMQIARELGESYKEVKDSQLNIRVNLLNQGFGTMKKITLIGTPDGDSVDAEKEWAGIEETGTEIKNRAEKDARTRIEEAAPGGWASLIKILETAHEKSRAVVLHFKRGKGRND